MMYEECKITKISFFSFDVLVDLLLGPVAPEKQRKNSFEDGVNISDLINSYLMIESPSF